MNFNLKIVAMVLVITVVVMIAGYAVWERHVSRPGTVRCANGSHPTIEPRAFTARYWTYSVKLEARVADKAKLSTSLDPKMLQQLSEALQETGEFSKLVAAGYNSCMITEDQYTRYGIQVSAAESLAQEIDSLLSKESMSPDEKAELAALINQYSDMVRRLGTG